MTARSVYFKSASVKELLAAQNAFFTKYGVQCRPTGNVTLFKVDTAFNSQLNEYESFLTIDMPIGGIGSRPDQVDNTRFNVSTPEEEEEIRREEEAKQQQIASAAAAVATPMPA